MIRGFVLFAVACLALAGQPPSETTFLELGKPIERELRGGEKHSYKVRAAAGQFFHVVALQEGIDVAVTLLDPSGSPVVAPATSPYSDDRRFPERIVRPRTGFHGRRSLGRLSVGRLHVLP